MSPTFFWGMNHRQIGKVGQTAKVTLGGPSYLWEREREKEKKREKKKISPFQSFFLLGVRRPLHRWECVCPLLLPHYFSSSPSRNGNTGGLLANCGGGDGLPPWFFVSMHSVCPYSFFYYFLTFLLFHGGSSFRWNRRRKEASALSKRIFTVSRPAGE